MSRLRALHLPLDVLRTSAGTTVVLVARLMTLAATLVLLTRAFGAATYGVYASAASIAFMMGIIPGAGAGYVLLSRIEQDHDAPGDIWSYSWPIICTVGSALIPAFILIAKAAAGDTHFSSLQLMILGFSELLATPLIVTLGFIIQARGHVALSQAVQWLPYAMRVGCASVAIWCTPELRVTAYLLLQLFTSFLSLCAALIIASRFARLQWKPRWANRKEIKEGASYGLMNLIALNPAELDKIITLRLLGSFDAGLYATAARIVGATVTPVTALLLSVQTRLFGRSAEGALSRRSMVIQVACAAVVWGLTSLVILELLSPYVTDFFGEDFKFLSQLIPWLSPAAPFIALRLSSGALLASLGRPFQRIAFELVGTAVLFVAMISLTSNYGLRGAAFALTLAEATMALTGWIMISRLISHKAEDTD